MKMKLMAILVCVLAISLAYQAASQTKPAPPHTPGSEKPKNKIPPGFEVIHCPEWMKVSFDQSKTPAGWTSYSFYENRVNDATVSKVKNGKQVLSCVYGGTIFEREVPANTCKPLANKSGFECLKLPG